MKPPVFAFVAPRSLPEALALLARHGEEGKVLARKYLGEMAAKT